MTLASMWDDEGRDLNGLDGNEWATLEAISPDGLWACEQYTHLDRHCSRGGDRAIKRTGFHNPRRPELACPWCVPAHRVLNDLEPSRRFEVIRMQSADLSGAETVTDEDVLAELAETVDGFDDEVPAEVRAEWDLEIEIENSPGAVVDLDLVRETALEVVTEALPETAVEPASDVPERPAAGRKVRKAPARRKAPRRRRRKFWTVRRRRTAMRAVMVAGVVGFVLVRNAVEAHGLPVVLGIAAGLVANLLAGVLLALRYLR